MSDSKLSATALAVEVLDEVRVSVLECLLALDAIGQEAFIDFEPLTESLAASGRVARQAFVAASLLHQGAELIAPSCADSGMKPGSIISRHLAAVAEGAVRTFPDRSDVDDFEAEIGGPPVMGSVLADQGRYLCSAAAVENSSIHTEQDCRLGSSGSVPSIEDDRDRYRKEIETALIGRRQRNEAVRREAIQSAGIRVVEQWMTRRAAAVSE